MSSMKTVKRQHPKNRTMIVLMLQEGLAALIISREESKTGHLKPHTSWVKTTGFDLC